MRGFVLFGVAFSSSSQAQLVLLGNVVTVQTDAGFYQQLPVKCSARSAPRFLRKASDSELWCDSILVDFCADRKIVAAEIVCAQRYYAALKKHQAKTQNSNTDSAESQLPNAAQTTQPDEKDSNLAVQQTKLIKDQEQKQLRATQTSAPEPGVQLASATASISAAPIPGKTRLELLQELRAVEQQLLDIQSQRLALRERDLQLLKRQLDGQK